MTMKFKRVAPYADDELNLPVPNVDEAIPYYVKNYGFKLVSRKEEPCRSAILERDNIHIGLAENGGDPTQEGCYFEVDDVEAAFREIKGRDASAKDIRVDKGGGREQRVFFDIAPDGLCFMFGQPVV